MLSRFASSLMTNNWFSSFFISWIIFRILFRELALLITLFWTDASELLSLSSREINESAVLMRPLNSNSKESILLCWAWFSVVKDRILSIFFHNISFELV